MSVRTAALVLSWFVCCSGLPAQTQGNEARLKVRVLDPKDLAVKDARVSLRPAVGGAAMESVTKEDGLAEFSPALQGRYLIEVRAAGFTDDSRLADWKEESATVEVRLGLAGLREQLTVTSGSRVEELQEDSPMQVDVVTRQAMVTTGYERVTDVLAEVPGVVTRSGSSGSVGTEQIHGINARQILVLQDGLPMVGARGIKSGNLNLNRQSTGRLDRIEVVKGAASSLFGSDAIGGVINMISREPTEKVQGNLNFSGGSLGIFDGRGDIGTRYKNLSLFLDLEHHRQDAYRLIPNSPTTVGPDLERNDLFFRTRYNFTPRIALGFSANAYHNHEEGQSAGETGLVRGLYNDSVQNYAVVGDFIPTASTTVQLRAYSARYDENSSLAPLTSPANLSLANLNQRYKRLDGTISQQLGRSNFLQGGYEWVQDGYKGANRLVGDNTGQQVTSNDFWLQDRVQLGKRTSVDLGGRVTSHSLFGTYAVPRAGMVVKLNDSWSARGSFGMGFRAPDLGQLYYRFANPASFYQVIGNPTLQPETSKSYSGGVDYRARRTRVGVTLFRNDVRNLIDTLNAGTPQTVAQMAELLARYGIPATFSPLLNRQTFIYQNFGRIYTQGFEVSAEQSITRNLRVGGAYTYLDAQDSQTGLALPQRHKHQGFVRTEYVNAKWGLRTNVRGMFYSKWYLNPATGTYGYGYGIWDFYVSKKLGYGLETYFTIDNLANSRDQKLALTPPSFDRPDYGRMYRVGLRWHYGAAE